MDHLAFPNDNDIESIGLLVTYRCNLDCKYCYIHHKRNQDMSFETARSIIEPFLLKKSGPLDIFLMGGETLLAFAMIRPLVEWAEKRKWNRPFRFFGSTNGTLLDENMKLWLQQHKELLILSLSYDGLPEVQEDNRGCDDIDVDFFIKTWPQQTIQMTINAESVDRMADGVIYLLEKGAVVHPNVAYERDEWPDQKIVEYEKQLNRLIRYYSSHSNAPLIGQFIHDLNEYADNLVHPKPQSDVCGAGNGFQVFDVDGISYPCHILSPLVLEGEKLEKIRSGKIPQTADFEDSRCSGCPFINTCSTCIGCNYVYRGIFQKRDRTHCSIMRAEIRAFIKMEAIRLSVKDLIEPKDATEIDSIIQLNNFMKSIDIKVTAI